MARASVVIPAYNAAADIEACLDALAASTESDLEILVVDDRSSDNTAELAARHGARVVPNPGPVHGPAAARNVGAREAAAEVLIFVDADVCVHRETIERALAQLDADPELGAIAGAYDTEPLARGDVAQWRNLLHCYTHRIARPDTNTFWTGFGAMRRSIFLRAGGMNSGFDFMEDMELGARLASSGVKLRLDASLQVQHRKRWTLGSMIRTDLFGRAIPYTKIMLREGMANDLNVRWSQRASVALAGLAVLLLAWSPLAVPVCLVLIAALNLDYYRFLSRVRGSWFALRTFPLHLVYFMVAGVGFAIAHLRWGAAGAAAVFYVLALGLQVWQGAYGADAYQADEPAHLVTGRMMRQYVADGFPAQPMRFAQDYYEHYPKVALGHWPPVFYALQAAWTLVFPATRDSLLVLIAALLAVLAAGVWKLVRAEYGSLAGWCAGVALLCMPSMANWGARVMTEIPLALFMFAAMVAWGRFLDSGRRADAAMFGVWSFVCLLTKGSALVLAVLPPLTVAFTGRWKLVRQGSFWLPAAIVAPASLWYLLAPGALHERAAAYGDPRIATWRLNWPPGIWAGEFGWTLAVLILLGMVWLLIRRVQGTGLSGVLASAWALALAGSIFPLLFGVWERRHQVEEAGAFLLVAVAGVGGAVQWASSGRFKSAVAILVTALVFRETVPWLPTLRSHGYVPLARTVSEGSAQTILVCCSASAEGAFIAALAEREPTPHRYVLRGTQLLSRSDWLGYSVTPTVHSRQEMRRLLEQSPIDTVVLDVRSEFGPRKMLENTLVEWPETWRRHGRSPLVWFTRSDGLNLSSAEYERRLRPLLPRPGL